MPSSSSGCPSARAALQSFNEELEQRIEQRTRERETALAQLFEAQKMDTIGRLTGGVAHDFNNLLMAVLGSLSLLEKRLPDDAQCRRLLQNAVQGAQRGAALTQRLLAFSRRQELKPESVNLSDLVCGMGELLEARPRDRGGAAVSNSQEPVAGAGGCEPARAGAPQPRIERARCDALRWNAHDPGEPTKSIGQDSDESALKPGEYVRVSVADTGVGMDEATLAKATDPFFTTKGPGKGTGLGLSMVHGLAAQSGGQLRIVSTPGVGTTVELWLPRAKTDAVSLVRSAERPPPAPATASWRVLIVDDDLLVLTGTAALIEDLGHVAIEVPSAAEALAMLAAGEAVDVIVTDHAMPNMTGLQLAHCVQEKYPGLPIVLATGYAELPADPAEFGVVKLAKPCSQAEIATAIQTAMGFARRDKLRAAGT